MLPPHSDQTEEIPLVVDSDPLLSFAEEPGEGAQTPAPAADPEPAVIADAAPEPPNDLERRVMALERALAEAKAEVALLRSDAATLVRSVDDIRSRTRKPIAAVPPPPNRNRGGARWVAAVACVLVGIAAGAWWLASSQAVAHPAPAVREEPALAPVEATPPLAPPVAVPVAAVAPISTPVREQPSTEPAARVNYVGTLSIDAAPGGTVFINRENAGLTPLRVSNLRAGSHLIWIERDGYRRWTRVVQVPSDRVTRLWADLEPASR